EIKDCRRVSTTGDSLVIELPVTEVLFDIPWTARHAPNTRRLYDYEWFVPHVHEIENRIDLPPGFAPPAPAPDRTPPLPPPPSAPATSRDVARSQGHTLVIPQRFDTGKARWTPAELAALQEALQALEHETTRIEVTRTARALRDAGKLREAAAEEARMIALHP